MATPRVPLLSGRATAAAARGAAAAAAAAAAAQGFRDESGGMRLDLDRVKRVSVGAGPASLPASPLRTGASRSRRATAPSVTGSQAPDTDELGGGGGGGGSEDWGSTTLHTPAAAAAMQSLSEQLIPEFVSMTTALRKADPDGLGIVTLHDFQQAMLHVGLQLQGAAFDSFAKRYNADTSGGLLYNKFLSRVGQCIHGGVAVTHVPSKLRTLKVPVKGFGISVKPPSGGGDGLPHDAELTVARNITSRMSALGVALTAALGRQVVRAQLLQNRNEPRPRGGHLATDAFVQALRGFGLKLSRFETAGLLDQCGVGGSRASGRGGVQQPTEARLSLLFAPLLAALKPTYKGPRKHRRATYKPENDVVVKPVYRRAAADKKVYYDAETALRLLGMKMYSKYRNVSKTFQLFDEDRNGSLTRLEFKERMQDLGFWLTDKEFDKLMTVFDADNSGEISFTEWNNLVGRIVQPGEGGAVFFKRTGDGGKHPVSEKAPIKEWAEAAFIQSLVRDAGGSLKAGFRLIDTDNDGRISQPELMTAARKYGLKMNYEQTARMAELYGLEENGLVTQEGFLKRAAFLMTRPCTAGAAELERLMQPRTYPVPLVTAEEVMGVLGKKLANKFKSVHKAFMKFNPSRKHTMQPRVLREAFEHNFGLYMSDYEWAKLMNSLFHQDIDTPITYHAFTRVVGELISPSMHWTEMAKLQNRSMPQLAEWVEEGLVRALIRGSGQDVAKVFAKIDTNNTGAISLGDMKKASEKAGLKLSIEEAGSLMAAYPTNSEGKVTLEQFAPVFTKLMAKVVETAPPPQVTRHAGAAAANTDEFTSSLKHIRDKQGRAMARALAKRQVEEKTGNVPLTRKYPVLRTNTLYHMEEVPTVNQFPTIDLHRKGAVFRSTPSRLTGAGVAASPAATSASPTLKHSASFPASLDNVHALDLGGVTGVGGGVPRYPTVPPPATPALSVLSAQDDDLLGGDRAEISLSGGASGVAVLRQAVRRKGRWRAVFKALRRADPSGSERVPMRDFMSAMSAAGVLAAVAKALESPDRDSDTLSDARRLITAVAARFPGASASKPGSSARSRGTSRSRARSPIVRPVYGDDATVAYVRFLRKLVPAAGPGQVFSPSRPVPQHLAHERPHTASGHLPYGFGTGRSAASGRSVDTGTFARQGDNNDAPPSSFPEVRHEVRREWREMRAALASHDTERTGVVPSSLFRRIMRKFGIVLQPREFDEVEAPFRALPPRKRGSGGSGGLGGSSSSASLGGSRYGSFHQPWVRYNAFLRAQLQHG